MVLVAAQGRTKRLFWNQDPLSRKGRAGSIPALRTMFSLALIENRQSLVPQGHRGIDLHRPARWQIAGQKRDEQEHQCDEGKG